MVRASKNALCPGDHFRGDLRLVRCFVRQHGFTADIADGVYMRHIGAHLLVDGYIATFIDGYARQISFDVTSVGTAADCHQHRIKGISALRARRIEGDLEATLLRLNT